MKQKVKTFLQHPLIYGSSIVVFGTLLANFFNFLFNLFMSRNLSVADYGTVASIISMIGFPALAATAIIPLVVQFGGSYFATGKLAMVRGLYVKITKFFLVAAAFILLFFLLLLPQLSQFFHINDRTILLVTAAIIFFNIIGVINIAFLQAKLSFGFQVFVTNVNTLCKFLFGMLFIWLSLSALGAAYAMLIGAIVAYLISFWPLKFIFDKKIVTPHINTKELFRYGLPSVLTLVGLTSLISADIILTKHYFTAHQAGVYAGLSLVGRVIFYLSSPIASVMFPIIVQKHSKKENVTNTFFLSLGLVLAPSLLLTAFYFLFPDFTLLFFLKKKEYLEASKYLGLFGIFISLYCALTIISNFYLSIRKTKIYIPIFLGAILQVLLICFYHQTFLHVIYISLGITFLLIIGLLLYYPYATKK